MAKDDQMDASTPYALTDSVYRFATGSHTTHDRFENTIEAVNQPWSVMRSASAITGAISELSRTVLKNSAFGPSA